MGCALQNLLFCQMPEIPVRFWGLLRERGEPAKTVDQIGVSSSQSRRTIDCVTNAGCFGHEMSTCKPSTRHETERRNPAPRVHYHVELSATVFQRAEGNKETTAGSLKLSFHDVKSASPILNRERYGRTHQQFEQSIPR